MGLVSGLSLANHSDSESFLVVYALFSQDGCQRKGFWEVVRHVVSPFDLSRILLVGDSLLVLWSLPGPLVIKQLMQMVTMVPGQGGRFQSVCFPEQPLLERLYTQDTFWELGWSSLSSVTSFCSVWVEACLPEQKSLFT